MLKRIVITGPESTGKSYLTKALAEHFKGNYVKEFAREYINGLNRPYKENDLIEIAKGQIAKEEEQAKIAKEYLFCDTDLTVIDIWSQEKFGRTDPWIKEQLQKRAYHLYLLCDIDLEWEEDPQRENPNDREYLLNLYHESLKKRKIKYEMVSGQGEERIQNAVQIIEKQPQSHEGTKNHKEKT